jgi:hypothetical protein
MEAQMKGKTYVAVWERRRGLWRYGWLVKTGPKRALVAQYQKRKDRWRWCEVWRPLGDIKVLALGVSL